MFRNRQHLRSLFMQWYWDQGCSLAEIAVRTQNTPYHIWRIFVWLQIPRRSRGGANNAQGRKDKQILWQGQVTTVAAVAREHGQYPGTVYKRMKRGLSLQEALQ